MIADHVTRSEIIDAWERQQVSGRRLSQSCWLDGRTYRLWRSAY